MTTLDGEQAWAELFALGQSSRSGEKGEREFKHVAEEGLPQPSAKHLNAKLASK